MNLIEINKVGAFIEPTLRTNQVGKVLGVTSKGVFLIFSQRVIFLTSEETHNPFMLYVQEPAQLPAGIALNQEVVLKDCTLKAGEVTYDLAAISEIVPKPLARVDAQLLTGRNAAQTVAIFQALNFPRHQDSFIFIADALLNRSIPVELFRQNLWASVLRLRKGVQVQSLKECETALHSLIGSGKGLTPSGDDFVAGYLLILNSLRGTEGQSEKFVAKLNSTALEMTRSRSTWISANLIEAATLRLVDERVGLAAKVLLGMCKMDPLTVARKLESFGNSSGIDAFTGMVAALVP